MMIHLLLLLLTAVVVTLLFLPLHGLAFALMIALLVMKP